jgi:hypothetical protein
MAAVIIFLASAIQSICSRDACPVQSLVQSDYARMDLAVLEVEVEKHIRTI